MKISTVFSLLSRSHPSDISVTRVAGVDSEVGVRQHVDGRFPVLYAAHAPNPLRRRRVLGIDIAVAIRMMMSHDGGVGCFPPCFGTPLVRRGTRT